MRLCCSVWLLAMLVLGGPVSIFGQQTLDPITELTQRLDALEQQNAQLRDMMLRQQNLPHEATGGDRDDWLHSSQEPNESLPLGIGSSLARYDELLASTESATLQQPGRNSSKGTVVGEDLSMTTSWRNGVEVSTKDKSFRYHVGGRWQFDTSWMDAAQSVQDNLPSDVRYHDAVDFRRLRLRFEGTMYEVMDFCVEYDLVSSLTARNSSGAGRTDFDCPALTDLWLQMKSTPLGNIRIGNQKEPIGLDHITSSRFLPFMERSYNQDAFYGGTFNGFSPGATIMDNFAEERAGYAIGVYKPVNNVFAFSINDGDYAATGRLAWLPIYEHEGRELVHLGISAREGTTYSGLMRFRTRDAIRSGPGVENAVPADVSIFGDRMQWINSEFIAVYGPWTAQAEWLVSFTSNARQIGGTGSEPRVESLFYQGGYIQLLYFLTGENDNYAVERMALDRVKPFENFFWVRGEEGSLFGRGAWQIGARYNYLDLNDQGINGGILHNLTLGLNWFFNPNTKWQFNYIATYRDVSQTRDFPDGSGWINGWGMRFAQDF
jgi:phosphate-selective porin OprO and OprP